MKAGKQFHFQSVAIYFRGEFTDHSKGGGVIDDYGYISLKDDRDKLIIRGLLLK